MLYSTQDCLGYRFNLIVHWDSEKEDWKIYAEDIQNSESRLDTTFEHVLWRCLNDNIFFRSILEGDILYFYDDPFLEQLKAYMALELL